jgi:hypothetical protein
MRATATILMVLLAGCGAHPQAQPDINACETFIKSELQSPSTYNRLSVASTDRQTSAEEMLDLYSEDSVRDLQKTLLEIEEREGLALRQVQIEYEAANSYGVPVRAYEICVFKLVGGSLEEADRLEANARMAKLRRAVRQYDELGLMKAAPSGRGGAKYACCL